MPLCENTEKPNIKLTRVNLTMSDPVGLNKYIKAGRAGGWRGGVGGGGGGGVMNRGI